MKSISNFVTGVLVVLVIALLGTLIVKRTDGFEIAYKTFYLKVGDIEIKDDVDFDIVFDEVYQFTIKSDLEAIKVDSYCIYVLPNDNFAYEVDDTLKNFDRLSSLTECFYFHFSDDGKSFKFKIDKNLDEILKSYHHFDVSGNIPNMIDSDNCYLRFVVVNQDSNESISLNLFVKGG